MVGCTENQVLGIHQSEYYYDLRQLDLGVLMGFKARPPLLVMHNAYKTYVIF